MIWMLIVVVLALWLLICAVVVGMGIARWQIFTEVDRTGEYTRLFMSKRLIGRVEAKP